jgi:tetratricopeptide (TPR) repeat protein
MGAILLILPSSSILPAADAVAYRRMYLPMAAIAIAIAIRIPGAVWALIGLAALQSAQWRTEQAAWQNAHGLAPDKTRPYIQLARTYPPREALALLQQAKEKAPRDAEVASHLGRVYLEAGDAAKALAEFGRALAIEPNQARHAQNRGVALLVLGQRDAAIADFQRALDRDPCLSIARENLTKLGVPPRTTCISTNSNVQ